MKRLITALLVAAASALTAAGAGSTYMFKHISMKDGLPFNQVNDIFCDSQGLVWFSTSSGLCRYDGYAMKTFQGERYLSDSFVNSTRELSDGRLLIEVMQSVFLTYDPRTDRVADFRAELDAFTGGRAVERVFVDDRKNIWMYCAGHGIFVHDAATGTTSEMLQGDQLPAGRIKGFACDGNDILMTYDDGLIAKADRADLRHVVLIDYLPRHMTFSGNCSIFVDSDGDYWVNTPLGDGLWFYERRTDEWKHMSSRSDSPIRISNLISGVAEDRHKRIWLACDHGGAEVVDKETHSVVSLTYSPDDPRSIRYNSINCVYCSPDGIVWLGYFKKGASFYSESIYKFPLDDFGPMAAAFDRMPDINSIAEDSKGNLWFATNGNGLIMKDGRTGQLSAFRHRASDAASLSNDVVVSVCPVSDGRLWVGTFWGGLNVYDGHRFVSLMGDESYGSVLSASNVWAITEDDRRGVWVGTLGGGLARYDLNTNVIDEYTESNGFLKSDYVSSVAVCRDGRVAAGTAVGLSIINPESGTATFISDTSEGMRIAGNNVNHVVEDSRGLVWVGTSEGLTALNFKNGKAVALRQADGLSGNVVHGIVEDENKNLWVTTSNGATNIIVSANPRSDDYNFQLYNYDELDGLQGHEFNKRSVMRDSYGNIYFGGTYGINRFRPEDIKYNKAQLQVRFTDLKLFNESVVVDSAYDGHVILDKSLLFADGISLKYSQNVFSVSFSTMSYILPEKVRYTYKLEGFNDNWMFVDGHGVTYTNLAPGSYVLKVRAINSDGFESDRTAELHIEVLPPFWRSRWAVFLYLIFLCAIVFYIRFHIQRKERLRFKLKQIEREAQSKHEMDNMRLRFFTNISHELRTPLSLIMSPLESLMTATTDKQQQTKLEMAYRNAVKLLNIVNQLLDFRKADVNTMQLQLSSGDVVAFVRNTSNSFVALSEKKSIQFGFSSDVDHLYMEFDEDKLGKIMLNLLSNAFKFTDIRGRVDVHVETLEADGRQWLAVRVSDTGIGISDADKPKVFDRFFQAAHASGAYGGSGIGLHLVKEFVTLHGGEVSVADNSNSSHGSTFSFTLPVRVPAAPASEAAPEAEEPVADGDTRSTLMVVDDNADFRAMLRESFDKEFRIVEAGNGSEALRLLENIVPDMILCDVMMPGMDGNELCRTLKTDVRTSHIPIIMLTARTAEEHKIEGLSMGADDYLTKPFNFDILNLKIHRLIEMGVQRRKKFDSQIELKPSEITITTLDEKLIRRAIKYVEDNISRSDLSVEEMSRELGMSRVHLYKKLMSITGKSPIEFIRVLRLKRAAQLLTDKAQNVSEVAYQVGFNNPKYFSRYFKEEFGVTPSVYQNNIESEKPNPMP